MNKALLKARQQFRGQKGNISVGYNQTNLPEGKYTCTVIQSQIDTVKDKDGNEHPQHVIRLRVEEGEHKGRQLRPFPPYLDGNDGILQSAKNIASILGDVVPGNTLPNGEFELDFDDFLAGAEDLAAQCIKELVEVTVRNGKKNKDDGTPWQQVYINRGLGKDSKALSSKRSDPVHRIDPKDNLDMSGGKKRRRARK